MTKFGVIGLQLYITWRIDRMKLSFDSNPSINNASAVCEPGFRFHVLVLDLQYIATSYLIMLTPWHTLWAALCIPIIKGNFGSLITVKCQCMKVPNSLFLGQQTLGEPGSSLSIQTRLRARRPGFISRQGQWWVIFFLLPLCPDQLWRPPSHLSNGYWELLPRR